MEKYKEIERSIIKKYRKEIWSKFVRAVQDYNLISEGDKIMVCMSGGKDSFLLAKCMEEIQKHGKFPFDVHYVCMNPGYNEKNKELILENAKKLNIDLEMFESDIFEVANAQDKNACFLCARMRRGCLYRTAQSLGCNKIALGHHYDDVIETTLMAMLYGGQIQAMPPMLRAKNFPGMTLIRPMYRVREADIIAWRDAFGLEFLRCACRLSESAALDETASKRQEIKRLISDLQRTNPKVAQNIFNSIHRVQLDTLVGWKQGGEEHSFLEAFSNS